jgi:predicted acylesterase/phospholipase RssA
MPRTKPTAVVLASVASLALAACAASIRPDAALIGPSEDVGTVPLFTASPASAASAAPAAAGLQVSPAAATKELHILAISGGGSDGAFGAGVLKGWSRSGTRPQFNIVTGVSTGALIASFAFLGPQWDGEIERFYTKITNENIYTQKGLSGLFGNSLYDTAPLRAVIEKAATRQLIDAVAKEHASGRRLFVATTDLDAGTTVVWDMGAIASSGLPGRYETYRDVLLASAAFPGFFEPVFVRDAHDPNKTRMHVDGGVKAPILLRSFMLAGPQKTKSVHMLVNGKLTLDSDQAPVKSTVLDITKRSVSELMRGLTYKTIYQGYVSAQQAKSAFRLMHVPDDLPDIDNALRFNPEEMRRLFEAGEKIGSDPSRWLNEPPRLEPLERISQR